MIRRATDEDFEAIFDVINDAAMAYRGVIPQDRWHEPYMTREALRSELEEGVRFSCFVEDGEIVGVMGIQDRGDVELIRHAYVRTARRKKGVGSLLLQELTRAAKKPILIGTWKAADWAIRFYRKHGFRQVGEEEKNRLLRRYWAIPERQIETSVVLAAAEYGIETLPATDGDERRHGE